MKLSTERILTTHVGSLPRPRSLLDLILAKEEGRLVDAAAFEAQSGGAVAEVDTPSLFLGQDQVEQRSRAGQAADTGSGNSLSAQFHGRLPHTLRPLKLMWPLERRGGVLPTVRQG